MMVHGLPGSARPGLDPRPRVGDTIDLFGVEFTVSSVVPDSDYAWSVTLYARNGGGAEETLTIAVPTDYRTDDAPGWPGAHYAWQETN